MNHTKGPWRAETPKTMFTSVTWIHSGNNIMNPMFGITGKNFKANAERIAACVNACEGIPNESLESMYIMGDTPMDRIKALKAECDLAYKVEQALIAALNEITYKDGDRYFIGITCDTDVTDIVGAAIAAAEGAES